MEYKGVNEKDVAVIGMSGRFPGAADLDGFWSNIRDGIESVTFFTDEELLLDGADSEALNDSNYVKAAPVIDGIDMFDATFFGYSPREAEIIDPQQRIFLELAVHALENAGYVPNKFNGLIGVYASVAWNTYLLSNLCTRPELFKGSMAFNIFSSNDKDFLPTRLSYKLNLRGPSMIIQTACSSSLVAVHIAVLSLLNYECDMAMAGGVAVKVPHKSGYYYQEGALASPDGHCRTFDADAKGTVFGSGAGVVVLKRAVEALEDGDNIYAIIKGSAINNDGSLKASYTAPSVEGQAEVIAAAQAVAAVEPDTIQYIETHGTGTAIGDPIEVSALARIFEETTDKKGFCALGSVKSNIGHLDAASGIAGFIKTVMTLKHGIIPPSPNFTRPNTEIDFEDSPFYISNVPEKWEAYGTPFRAGVSSFGVGGTNAHVILEEAPVMASKKDSEGWKLLILSAKTQSALSIIIRNLTAYFKENPDLCLTDAAYTLQVGREAFNHRCAFMCRNMEEAIIVLENHVDITTIPDIGAIFIEGADRILAETGRRWISGTDVEWRDLYREKRCRISLPVYPFERKRYWIEAAKRNTGTVIIEAPAELHPRPELNNPYTAPANELEQVISDIWAKTLGFDKVGVHDNFFELGGDSLIAVKMVNTAKSVLKRDIEAASLYQALNVRSLAELLEKNESQAVSELAEQFAGQKGKMDRRKQLQHKMRMSKMGRDTINE